MQWYLKVLKTWSIDGRAQRTEYWMFTLINFLVSVGLLIVDAAAGLTYNAGANGILQTLYSLAVLIPGIAVTVRRFHDVDWRGWWFLAVVVPVVGWIFVLVLLCLDGTPGRNRFGDDPLGRSAQAPA